MANRYQPEMKCCRCKKRKRHSAMDGMCVPCAVQGYRTVGMPDPAAKDIREARIPYYTERASLGLPLFPPPANL